MDRLPNLRSFWPLILVILIATILYTDGLFRHKSLMYVDAIVHGYPVLSYDKSVIEGDASPLWTNLIYGGHPLHAEGQFSFLNPLNVAVAFLLPPELGQNVYHWLSLILTGLGMVALCRSLGLSPVATAVASLAVPFSGFWLFSQVNITISGGLALIPWALWSFEKWLANPSQYLTLAIIMALVLFSGYPQSLHGAAIYMAVSLVSIFVTAESRNRILHNWKAYLGFGLAAVIICIGIAAVQLLPLLELIDLSVRNQGVQLLFAFPSFFYRGLLFTSVVPNAQEPNFPVVGSLLVCAIASMVVVYKPGARFVGHLVAAFFLFNLGLGLGSPIFTAIYNSDAPLGLHYFRMTATYFAMAIIGISLIAAASIDKFQVIDFRLTSTKVKLFCLFLLWTTFLAKYAVPDAAPLQYIVAAMAVMGGIICVMFSTRQYFGPLLIALLVAEILFIKSQMLAFHDNELLKAPQSVTFIKDQADYQDYKIFDFSKSNKALSLSPPWPGLDQNMLERLNAIQASTNMLWNISSFEGAHALPLSRRMLAAYRILKELEIVSEHRAGLRLMDYLGIKFIIANDYTAGESFQPVYQDELHKVKIVDNTAALPRFQTFTDYQWVESPQAAVVTISKLETKVLVLERPKEIADIDAYPKPEPEYKDKSNGIDFVTEEANSTYYKFSVTAENPGFFFVADANYPGWKAKIDGKPAQVFSAQVLGKAVMLPQGKHTLEIYFQSNSFRLGLTISIITLLLATALGLRKWPVSSRYNVQTGSDPASG